MSCSEKVSGERARDTAVVLEPAAPSQCVGQFGGMHTDIVSKSSDTLVTAETFFTARIDTAVDDRRNGPRLLGGGYFTLRQRQSRRYA